jgi:hypothetical protein
MQSSFMFYRFKLKCYYSWLDFHKFKFYNLFNLNQKKVKIYQNLTYFVIYFYFLMVHTINNSIFFNLELKSLKIWYKSNFSENLSTFFLKELIIMFKIFFFFFFSMLCLFLIYDLFSDIFIFFFFFFSILNIIYFNYKKFSLYYKCTKRVEWIISNFCEKDMEWYFKFGNY